MYSLSSTPSQYPLLICCHPFSPANHLLIENHRSLVQIYTTSSLESTSRFISSASPVLSRFTSPSTCQHIFVIILTLNVGLDHAVETKIFNWPTFQILTRLIMQINNNYSLTTNIQNTHTYYWLLAILLFCFVLFFFFSFFLILYGAPAMSLTW